MDEEAAARHAAAMRFHRMMEEWRAKRDIKCEEKAKAKGFSSWEKYMEFVYERESRRHAEHERHLDEKCARLGKTREELQMEDPQRDIPGSWPPECDCDG